ncbi:MAG: DUF692 domain-containing protein [Micropepsaceae bacterium]
MSNDTSPVVGIGLRSKHFRTFDALRPALPFVEVHAENHLAGGEMRRFLHDVRKDYEISVHCVGISVGSVTLDENHIKRIRCLIDEIDPFLVSDHLSISQLGAVYTNDLLPLPYTEESLRLVCSHVDEVQILLGREILIENPSRYISYAHSTISEGEFLDALARRTGCGLLCDVNNIFVTARNERRDPIEALMAFPHTHVRQFHLAGHDTVTLDGGRVCIDTHDRAVCQEVWDLFGAACERTRGVPTLIEWDNNLPELEVLLDEAAKASAHQRYAASRSLHAAAR